MPCSLLCGERRSCGDANGHGTGSHCLPVAQGARGGRRTLWGQAWPKLKAAECCRIVGCSYPQETKAMGVVGPVGAVGGGHRKWALEVDKLLDGRVPEQTAVFSHCPHETAEVNKWQSPHGHGVLWLGGMSP